MDDIDIATDFSGAIARNVARKRQGHYRPPYAMAESLGRAQAADIVRLEEIANIADVEPRVRISYELDCTKHLARRLDLASALVATPKVLFMDEPTTGLDPASRLDLWELLADLVTICRPHAQDLGCEAELDRVPELGARTGAQRQIDLARSLESLPRVVGMLASDFLARS